MAAELVGIEAEFQQFLQDLTNVEKKVIHALTDIARDILQTRPQGAPVVAAVITRRVVQAPVALKLPTLYLLDSIVKLVGGPYVTYFGERLPEAFAAAWHTGNDNLQKSLQKLYGTWSGVFPQHVLTEVAARIAHPAPAMPLQYAVPVAAAAPSFYQPGQAVVEPQPLQPYAYSAPQAAPVFSAGFLVQEVPQPQSLYAQPALPLGFGAPQPVQPAAAYMLPQQQAASQQLAAPAATAAAAAPMAPPQQPVNLSELMASLVNSGILAAPTVQPVAASGVPGDSSPPAAAGTPLRPEEPVSLEFTPERIKESNPAAVHRLLQQTESTKGRFLDRKFLRRQRRSGSTRVSRLWYVDLDTWMASTVGVGTAQAAEQQQDAAAVAAAAAPAEQCTVPVDDSQTHCALSGERFQQFWDEQHQEWRYKDAKRLGEEEAARYGLQEGAIVLVSALGAPAGNLLQPTGGVLSSLAAEQQVAADLAAAATGAAGPGGEAAAAAEQDSKQDVKLGVKHERGEGPLGGPEAAEHLTEPKRLRVH